MTNARIDLDDVRVHRRRRPVLDGCSARIGPGLTVLVGGNGAGKSTLLAAAAGLVPVSSGTISIGGAVVDRTGLTRRQGRYVGYLPQEPRLPSRITVAEAIDYSRWLHRPPARSSGDDGAAPAFTTSALTDRLGLTSVVDRPVGELSGGMNRLAMLAVAVVHRPAVLLLDEATAGVDVEHRATFRAFLGELRDSTAVLLSSHLASDVEHLADRVLVLARGRIAFAGDVTELDALGREQQGDHESLVEAAVRTLTAGAAGIVP